MAQSKLIYADKSNNLAIVNRETQATAEDFNEIKETVNNNANDVESTKPIKISITAASTPISVALTGADYEIEVVLFRLDSGQDGRDIVVINNKTALQFTVVTPDDYVPGVLVYRVLNFN